MKIFLRNLGIGTTTLWKECVGNMISTNEAYYHWRSLPALQDGITSFYSSHRNSLTDGYRGGYPPT